MRDHVGISAFFSEPDHLDQLTNKSLLFRLPSGSSYYHFYL